MSRRHLPYLTLLLTLNGCSTLSTVTSQSEDTLHQQRLDSEAAASIGGTNTYDFADSSRRSVRRFVVWLGEGVNDWFGDKPFSEGGKVSHGRLSVRLRWQEDDGVDTNVRFNARFELPNLRDKAYVFFGQENKRNLIADQPETFTREQLLTQSRRDDQTGFLGLGVNLRDYVDFRVGVHGGLKPYSQARYRRQWMLSAKNRVEFGETLFWRSREGFGSTTLLELEHAYAESLLFKWQNAATITKETDGFAWSSSVGAFKILGNNNLLSMEALVNGETDSKDYIYEYGTRLRWLQPIYRDWLLIDLILGHFWPSGEKDPERQNNWAASAGLMMHF
ncbi:MAG: hypothetical protein WCX90_10325 [Thiohalomonadaceae bacterium]|nr:hypothetical protein [Porticoccaceae bacterium]